MLAFQLYESTLDLAQALNNGVRPEHVDNEIKYFIYKGENDSEIISNTEFKERYAIEDAKDILLYKVKGSQVLHAL